MSSDLNRDDHLVFIDDPSVEGSLDFDAYLAETTKLLEELEALE